MLQLTKIELRRGRKLLFEDATLQVHSGQRMGVIGINGSGKSSLFSLILQDLESDAGDLQLSAKDVIAHVAQQSPSSDRPALEFVLDGDHGLRDLQREIADLESKEAHNDKLHGLYEQMDNIDGYTAETRGRALITRPGICGSRNTKACQRVFRWLADASEPGTSPDVPLRYPAAG